MTVFILIVIGTIHGQPQVAPVGVYQTADACQRQWQLLSAGAMLNANSSISASPGSAWATSYRARAYSHG